MASITVRSEDDLRFLGRHGALPARPTTESVAAIVERAKEIRSELGDLEEMLRQAARDAPLGADRDAARSAACALSDIRREVDKTDKADPLAAIAGGREVSDDDRERVIL